MNSVIPLLLLDFATLSPCGSSMPPVVRDFQANKEDQIPGPLFVTSYGGDQTGPADRTPKLTSAAAKAWKSGRRGARPAKTPGFIGVLVYTSNHSLKYIACSIPFCSRGRAG